MNVPGFALARDRGAGAPETSRKARHEMTSNGFLKIGEFARRGGTNLRTLRYYEELGLLVPAARSEGGFRFYREADLNRLEMIRDLQELGLHLDEIGELIGTRGGEEETRPTRIHRVREALFAQDRLIAERMHDLELQRERIGRAIEKLEQCEHCRHVPSAGNNFCEPCSITGQPLPKKVSALF